MSVKRAQKIFKLSSNDAICIFDVNAYTIICKKCSSAFLCQRHGHIPYCYDHTSKPKGTILII